eukprot:COSAG03_NODE_558_length_6950_cov_4.520362_1_plen_32_part_00
MPHVMYGEVRLLQQLEHSFIPGSFVGVVNLR